MVCVTDGTENDSLSLGRQCLSHFIVKNAGHFWRGSRDLCSNLIELYACFLFIIKYKILLSIICSIMIYMCVINIRTLESSLMVNI